MRAILCILAVLAFGITPAAVRGSDIPLTRSQARSRAAQLAMLGRHLFFDPALSASGKRACATCHDAAHAFGPPNALAVQLGGKDLRQPGIRAVPSLKYLQAAPQFTEHYYESDEDGDASIDSGPTGGLTWDGRVDRSRDQANIPLFSPFEMANTRAADVVAAVARADYAGEMRSIFGASVFDQEAAAFAGVLMALEAYQQDFRAFYPYSSKYDAYLAGVASLTAPEARGLALFQDPKKGNCDSCHRSRRDNDGGPPQFTDYGLIALGLPRNTAIPANSDPDFFDLGACGPLRTDLRGRGEYCGRFVTPTLRNVALRQTFFHNGLVHTLRQAIEFYVQRDREPDKWYPRDDSGRVRKFDDLPPAYRAYVNMEPPFGGQPGEPPLLSGQDIDDIIAFLETLTDGYEPKGSGGAR